MSLLCSPQVLGSVKNRIEAFAASHEDFPAMLKKAQQYLVARGKVDWTDSPGVPTLRRSDSLGEHGNKIGGGLMLEFLLQFVRNLFCKSVNQRTKTLNNTEVKPSLFNYCCIIHTYSAAVTYTLTFNIDNKTS